MKKILFLTRSYPNTLGSATVLCTHRVMECVAESGLYEVHVLCCRFPGEDKNEIGMKNLNVHRFRPSLWKNFRNCISTNKKYQHLDRICELIQKIITIPFFPQTLPITTTRYYRAAAKLHQKEAFDLIISEHHGLDSLLTGCRLMKKFEGLNHVALLWDPVRGQIPTTKLPQSYTDYKIGKVEEFVSKYTTLQISTQSMQAYHKNHGDVAAAQRIYLDIPGILKPEDEVPTDYLSFLDKDYVNVVFSGLLNQKERNALPIIKLLNQCDIAERINLVFFSRGQQSSIEKEIPFFKGRITQHDYIPLKELHTIYRHADYLLNVSHINANMVPSKIFEYMSYGKPIISTYVTDGDAAEKYISRYPEGLCIDLKQSNEEIVKKINNFFSQKHQLVEFEIIKEMYGENTPEIFVRKIEEVLQ